jgi:hypothetical protein
MFSEILGEAAITPLPNHAYGAANPASHTYSVHHPTQYVSIPCTVYIPLLMINVKRVWEKIADRNKNLV